MSPIHNTSNQNTFEGRPLDRPEEDIEDQGLHFDLTTIQNRVSRRGLLGMFGIGAGATVLAACSPGSSTPAASSSATSSAAATTAAAVDNITEMKTETGGPYPGDGSNGPDVLEEVGVERQDIRSSIGGGATADGIPMTLTMNIIDMANNNAPMTGAAVYLWHCDAQGRYSMYSEGVEDETYCRGVQVVGEDGKVTFTSIIPGCYDGRWPHLHFEVFPDKDSISDASNAVLTSQIAIPEEVANTVYAVSNYDGSAENLAKVSLDTDGVFSDGADAQLPETTGDIKSGYTMNINVGVDTTTEQESPSMGGGQGGPGGTPPSGDMGGPGGTPPNASSISASS